MASLPEPESVHASTSNVILVEAVAEGEGEAIVVNNQLIQILFASGLALDVNSIMDGRGNTTIMVGIIEEV